MVRTIETVRKVERESQRRRRERQRAAGYKRFQSDYIPLEFYALLKSFYESKKSDFNIR